MHTQGVFLSRRGARYIGNELFEIDRGSSRAHGRYPDDPKVFPDIWTIGFVIGQNVLAHDTPR